LDIAFFPGRRLLGLSTIAILIAGGAAAASRQHQGSKEHQAKNQQSGKPPTAENVHRNPPHAIFSGAFAPEKRVNLLSPTN